MRGGGSCENMGFSHFHEFGILYGLHILAPYQIDIVKGCGFCKGNIILIWYWSFYQQIMILKDENNIKFYLIFYFLLFYVREFIIVSVLWQNKKYSKIRTLSHRTPTKSNKVTKGNKRINWLRKLILYFKYTQ